MPIREQEYRITENDSNNVATVGVANTMTTVFTYTCPNATANIIRAGDIFSVYFDVSGTEVGDSTAVELEIRDSNNITRNTFVTANYGVLNEFSDRQKIYIFGQSFSILANQQLVVRANATGIITLANSRMQVSTIRGSAVLY